MKYIIVLALILSLASAGSPAYTDFTDYLFDNSYTSIQTLYKAYFLDNQYVFNTSSNNSYAVTIGLNSICNGTNLYISCYGEYYCLDKNNASNLLPLEVSSNSSQVMKLDTDRSNFTLANITYDSVISATGSMIFIGQSESEWVVNILNLTSLTFDPQITMNRTDGYEFSQNASIVNLTTGGFAFTAKGSSDSYNLYFYDQNASSLITLGTAQMENLEFQDIFVMNSSSTIAFFGNDGTNVHIHTFIKQSNGSYSKKQNSLKTLYSKAGKYTAQLNDTHFAVAYVDAQSNHAIGLFSISSIDGSLNTLASVQGLFPEPTDYETMYVDFQNYLVIVAEFADMKIDTLKFQIVKTTPITNDFIVPPIYYDEDGIVLRVTRYGFFTFNTSGGVLGPLVNSTQAIIKDMYYDYLYDYIWCLPKPNNTNFVSAFYDLTHREFNIFVYNYTNPFTELPSIRGGQYNNNTKPTVVALGNDIVVVAQDSKAVTLDGVDVDDNIHVFGNYSNLTFVTSNIDATNTLTLQSYDGNTGFKNGDPKQLYKGVIQQQPINKVINSAVIPNADDTSTTVYIFNSLSMKSDQEYDIPSSIVSAYPIGENANVTGLANGIITVGTDGKIRASNINMETITVEFGKGLYVQDPHMIKGYLWGNGITLINTETEGFYRVDYLKFTTFDGVEIMKSCGIMILIVMVISILL